MRITLQIDQGHAIDLPHSVVEDVVSFLEDTPSNAHFFEELSKHASSQVRVSVAAKTHLSVDALERLANDTSIEVVQAIVWNDDALKSLSLETLQLMIRRDVSIAKAILAVGLDDISHAIKEVVIGELAKYKDPAISDELAKWERENY